MSIWRYSGCFLCICLICCRHAEARGAEAKDPTLAVFPFDGYSGAVRVPVVFDGVAHEFLIDTGSELTSFQTCMSPLLTATERWTKVAGIHDTVEAQLHESPAGTIGNLPLPPLKGVYCQDRVVGRFLRTPPDGYLAMDALRNYILKIAYDRGEVSFLRHVPAGSGTCVPLDARYLCPTISGRLGRLRRSFTLDTGRLDSGSGYLPPGDFDEIAYQGLLRTVDDVPAASLFTVVFHRAAILSIPLRIAKTEHAALAFNDLRHYPSEAGILGVGYLRRFIVTFDFPASAVYLLPSASYRDISTSQDPGGFRLRRMREHIMVSAVGWRCPASEAGIEVGDVLLRINGRRSEDLGGDAAVAVLISRCDTPTSFVFQRPSTGELIHFTYDAAAERRQ